MKSQFYENKKRNKLLPRISKIFDVNTDIAKKMLSINSRQSININTLKVKDEKRLIKKIKERGVELIKIPWVDHAYCIDQDKHKLPESLFFKEGLIYIQNASSFIPVLLLDPQPGERVLDLCAAPGGKATNIAFHTNNEAKLWANDSSPSRVETMKEIFKKYGVEPEEIMVKRAENIDPKSLDSFDKIILDAQCSGEGMINLNNSRALRYWSESRINKFQSLQKKMIKNAYKLLKPGGVLVYSTCTFAPEENELVIDFLTKKYDDMKIMEMDENIDIEAAIPGLTNWQGRSLSDELSKCIRIIPNLYMEGFFTCKLKKLE